MSRIIYNNSLIERFTILDGIGEAYIKYIAKHTEGDGDLIIVDNADDGRMYATPMTHLDKENNSVEFNIVEKESVVSERVILIDEIYKHFKGDKYLILDIALYSKTGEILVIYKALYEGFKIYARPYDMFIEKVPEGKENPTGQEFRFERLIINSVN